MELQRIQNVHRMNKEEYDGQKQALQEQLQREVCQCHKPLLHRVFGRGFYMRSPLEYSVMYCYVLGNLGFQ